MKNFAKNLKTKKIGLFLTASILLSTPIQINAIKPSTLNFFAYASTFVNILSNIFSHAATTNTNQATSATQPTQVNPVTTPATSPTNIEAQTPTTTGGASTATEANPTAPVNQVATQASPYQVTPAQVTPGQAPNATHTHQVANVLSQVGNILSGVSTVLVAVNAASQAAHANQARVANSWSYHSPCNPSMQVANFSFKNTTK